MKPALCIVLAMMAMSALAIDTQRAQRGVKARRMLARAELDSSLGMLRSAAERGLLSNAVAHAAVSQLATKFESYEHQFGMTQLQFDVGVDAVEMVSTSTRALHTDDDILLTMDEMVALSGDYFGVKDEVNAIMCNDPLHGRTEADQPTRFWKAFNDLWHNPRYGKDAPHPPAILKPIEGDFTGTFGQVVDQIRAAWAADGAGIAKEKGPTRGSDFYSKESNSVVQYIKDFANAYSPSITGKGRSENFWRALAYNDDHFNWCAENTHRFGHIQAMNLAYAAGQHAKTLAGIADPTARAAKRAEIKKELIRAYGVSGFVSHQLSDLFSAGHLRTPRSELRDVCVSGLKQAPAAGITANVQHDEDNVNCLLSKNLHGDTWWVCGDRRYFDDVNANNRRVQHVALDAAMKEVRAAFDAGKAGQPNPNAKVGFTPAGLLYIPHQSQLTQREALENTCSLTKTYTASNGKHTLYTRTGINEVNGMPRPPIARRNAYGSSLLATASNVIFPTALTPLPALSPIPAGTPAADLECQYVKMEAEHCCSVPARATPRVATETFPEAAGKRKTWINCCKITQTVLGAADKLSDKASDMRAAASGQNAAKAFVTNAAAGVVQGTADALVGVHHAVETTIKPVVARTVTEANRIINEARTTIANVGKH